MAPNYEVNQFFYLEQPIIEYITISSKISYGLTISNYCNPVYDLVKANNLIIPEN